MRAQWWFTLDTIDWFAKEIGSLVGNAGEGARILCIGAPSVAFRLVTLEYEVATVDADPHVVEVLKGLDRCDARIYDVHDPLPADFEGRFHVVIMDPPWYMDDMRLFVRRGSRAAMVGGSCLFSMPPRLVRPQAAVERSTLISDLVANRADLRASSRAVASSSTPAAGSNLASGWSRSRKRGDEVCSPWGTTVASS